MKKIYIAGKITGENEKECKEKFLKAEFILKNKGYIPMNPMRLVSSKLTWKRAMLACFDLIANCDEAFFLSDWKDSKGALLEHEVCKSFGLTITYQEKYPNVG